MSNRFFQGGRKFFWGFRPLAPPLVTGLIAPLTFQERDNGGKGDFFITAPKVISWFVKIELKCVYNSLFYYF